MLGRRRDILDVKGCNKYILQVDNYSYSYIQLGIHLSLFLSLTSLVVGALCYFLCHHRGSHVGVACQHQLGVNRGM